MSFTKPILNTQIIDFTKSECKFALEEAKIKNDYSYVIDFYKIVLKENDISSDIFTLDTPSMYFITGTLKQKFDDAGVTGFTYTSINEYNEMQGKK